MSTIRGVKDRRFKFVQILNSMFEDPDLSLKAKGFIGYCLTKTEDWKFHVNHLCTVLKEREKAIYSTIDECISQGYAYRYQTRKENGEFGEWETIISDSKEEIIQITLEIKKSFTLPQKGDADKGDPDSAPLSNNNNIAIKTIDSGEASPLSTLQKNSLQKKEKTTSQEKEPLIAYGELVKLTQSAYDKLCQDHGKDNVDYIITHMTDYCLAKGDVKVKDWAAKIRCWLRNQKTYPSKAHDANTVNSADSNKDLSKEVVRQLDGKHGLRIVDYSDHIAIGRYDNNKPFLIFYNTHGFKDQLYNTLRKHGINIRDKNSDTRPPDS